jgi:hypothetical protein
MWEYKVLVTEIKMKLMGQDTAWRELEPQLNVLGREGWELVSVVPVSQTNGFTNYLQYTFKRPINR